MDAVPAAPVAQPPRAAADPANQNRSKKGHAQAWPFSFHFTTMTKLPTLAFFALCLWSSAAWIAAGTLPSQLPALQSQGFHFLLLALATTIVCLSGKTPVNTQLRLILPGLALFAAPLILLTNAQTLLSSSYNVLVFALLPIVIVVAQGQIRWLIPALAGVAGILVLLPVSLPETPRACLGLALVLAAMALTAWAILTLHRTPPTAWSIAAIFLATALILTLASPVHTPWSRSIAATEALRCLLLDAPEVLLLLWLIPRLDPRRLSARWLLAPLLTVMEGYLLMRPAAGIRLLIGLALLAIGGAILLLAPDEHPESLRLY
ncbi:hypothetical protein SAMN05421771_3531 [Granulicella pectinivorans]|uniref:EamA-like transporter family protein n=1 Tax=Granulicella pectinivorans TaxID=474950 RepID=A0A1I6MSF0_9BACT|nr:hypothetical protein SAMN05421771_3531 [Granulicella pectinivorans]